MKKVLPLCIRPYITSECWTYYKFAILQTEKTHEDWLFKFMNVWTEENGHSIFGDIKERFQPSFYNEILDIQDGDIWSCSEEDIIQYIISAIEQGEYVVVDVNYNIILKKAGMRIHEILIYGYDDDKKCFYSPILTNGIFKETQIDYTTVRKAYSSIINHYKQDHYSFYKRRDWFYGLTLIKPKMYVRNPNQEYDFIKSIDEEKAGFIHKKYMIDQNFKEDYSYTCYTGLSSLLLVKKIITDSLSNGTISNDTLFDLKFTCLKIYEHQNILLNCMRVFSNRYNAATEFCDIINDYEHNCKQLYLSYLLLEKYVCTQNNEYLVNVTEKLSHIYHAEFDVLFRFQTLATTTYIEKGLF